VAGCPFEDESVLAVAAAIEREFGYRPPLAELVQSTWPWPLSLSYESSDQEATPLPCYAFDLGRVAVFAGTLGGASVDSRMINVGATRTVVGSLLMWPSILSMRMLAALAPIS